jgi:hypothetical protein
MARVVFVAVPILLFFHDLRQAKGVALLEADDWVTFELIPVLLLNPAAIGLFVPLGSQPVIRTCCTSTF